MKNTTLDRLLAVHTGRREVLKAAGLAGMLAVLPACTTRGGSASPGFTAIPVSTDDAARVPPGYRVQVLYAWGDPVGIPGAMPAFRWDASNSAADQALQAGMHHDAIEYFPLPDFGSRASARALLAINHEYTDDGLLHPDGMQTWSAEKVRKSQAGHGVAVIEVAFEENQWKVVRPSRYARRITGYTPMRFAGPAAGSPLLGDGSVLGTLNNCAGGITPWGTYLTCEENFNGYFVNAGTVPPEQRRYGINARGFGYRWHEFDKRFDAGANPLEPNKFGWVSEIDPYDPASVPVKRTALGRFKHEGAMVTLAADSRVVVYMGDDERFEYVYKFVSRDRYNPGFNPSSRAANRDLLDHGALYAARFNDNGSGEWLPLPMSAEGLVNARASADRAGATKMDRPEWVAVHPETKDVYVTLTNNSSRGAKDQPGVDPTNPRANNVYGHIVKWREEGGDPAATKFRWDHFVLAGDVQSEDPRKRGNINGDAFGSPDGLWFDRRGVLWIQTDVSTNVLNRGDYARLGNNQMLAADVTTGQIRRFFTGPRGCEVTGATMAPDGRSLFVNIQHPGEAPSERSDPASPRAVSNWPDFRADGRPRSATLVIRREDGGIVGT
jgi:secreted PhoX family phosphatase